MASLGTLFVIGLPIGHRDDISLRAVRLLRGVDIIAAKDPQTLQPLLRHHRISAVLTTYSRETALEKTPILLDRLRRGRTIALVSNRGTPSIYDPGSRLVAQARRAGIKIVSVPGPSALTSTIAIAGMPADTLYFRGRFPTSKMTIDRLLSTMRTERCSSIFFVPADRLRRILALVCESLGNRKAVVAVDLTKPTERVFYGTIRTLLAKWDPVPLNADVTLVIAGR